MKTYKMELTADQIDALMTAIERDLSSTAKEIRKLDKIYSLNQDQDIGEKSISARMHLQNLSDLLVILHKL